MILTGGRVYTLDPADRVVDTLVVRDGRIAFAGHRSEVTPRAGERVLDLGGRAVLPGLVDAHGHLMHAARARLAVDLTGARSEAEAAERVAAAAARRPAGEWIGGRGWDQTRWPAGRFPTKSSLDRAAPRHPASLVRVDGHALWTNSAALAAAGIDRHTPDPPGGLLGRDPHGVPTGLLIDAAMRLVQAVEPRPSSERFEAAVADVLADCLARGLTGVHEMGADLEALAAYRRLVAAGRFPFRSHVAVREAAPEAWAAYRERGPETIGDGRVAVRALKLVADGALGSRGAALHAPYSDDPGTRGLVLLDADALTRLTLEAGGRGFQVCVHAIGDRANTLALDAFEAALARGLRPAAPLRIEHAQVLRPEDIPRFRRLGVVPSMQPSHYASDLGWAAARLGPDRLAGAYAWRSLLRTGVVIAAGSDFPVEDANPFHGIHAAVSRPGFTPEERMTRAEAVRAFTSWAARAAGEADRAGTLEAGKHADLVVCTEDVFTCPVERIRDIRPVLVMVAGEVVFPPDGAAAALDGSGMLP